MDWFCCLVSCRILGVIITNYFYFWSVNPKSGTVEKVLI